MAVLAGYALGFPAVILVVFRGRRQALLHHWRESMAFLGGAYFLCSGEIASPYRLPYIPPSLAVSGVLSGALGVVGGGSPASKALHHMRRGLHR